VPRSPSSQTPRRPFKIRLSTSAVWRTQRTRRWKTFVSCPSPNFFVRPRTSFGSPSLSATASERRGRAKGRSPQEYRARVAAGLDASGRWRLTGFRVHHTARMARGLSLQLSVKSHGSAKRPHRCLARSGVVVSASSAGRKNSFSGRRETPSDSLGRPCLLASEGCPRREALCLFHRQRTATISPPSPYSFDKYQSASSRYR